MEIKKSDIQKWCIALRSGKYKQTQNVLQENNRYCCLGVACKIFIPKEKLIFTEFSNEIKGYDISGQPNAPEWLKKINDDVENKFYKQSIQDKVEKSFLNAEEDNGGVALTHLNDNTELNFNEIADVLELVYIHNALNT